MELACRSGLALGEAGGPLARTWAAWVPEHPLPAGWWAQVLGRDPQLAERQVWHLGPWEAPLAWALTARAGAEDPKGAVALVAVAPEHRRQGLGRQVAAAALAALAQAGCARATWGAGLHHAFPGAPKHLEGAWPMARALGFEAGRWVHDVVGPAQQPLPLWTGPWRARPCTRADQGAVLAMLDQHFPGRWPRDLGLAWAQGEAPEQCVGVFDPQGRCGGFAWTHPPEAAGAARWQGLAPGHGALGPLGLMPALRGGGRGLALVAEGLGQLAAQGVERVVIDWTDLVDFYARLGFAPAWSYLQAERPLSPEGSPP